MKISRLQQEEIDFLSKHYTRQDVTQDIVSEYISHTVFGIGIKGSGKNSDNPLIRAKRTFDMMLKMWREDIVTGLISVQELKEDFQSPYFDRVIDSLVKNISGDFRRKVFAKNDNKGNILSITNFPKVTELIADSLIYKNQ